jgi:phosphoglycolate phosphatase/putative hydrolase of the HAD superfamily
MYSDLQLLNWSKIKLVIFDVDGTLYSQAKLRKWMLRDLLGYYMLRPWRYKELLILQKFRSEREHRNTDDCTDLENAQYTWCAEKQQVSASAVRKVTDKWIFTHPNQYLSKCAYPGINSFFNRLRRLGIKTAIYSDYKAHDKLTAMNLSADLVVSSTDPHIDKFKPHPKGLMYIAEQMGLNVDECLFIGDRDEKDGLCARNAGMPYVIIDAKTNETAVFYSLLEQQLNTKP